MPPRPVARADGRRAGKYGRNPNDPSKPRLIYSQFARAVAVPAAIDWGSNVTSWPMYLNDSLGDCTVAEVGHQLDSASTYGEGTGILVSDNDIETMYEGSGYNPSDPSTDQGWTLQGALGWWRTNGLAGHKCLAFAELNVADLAEIKQAVWEFCSADIGCTIYQGDEDAFNAGQPWDTNYSPGAVAGGHSVEIVSYDATGGNAITWGAVQRFTWKWWQQRVDEAWLAVIPEWLNARGVSPVSLDLYQLGQAMQAMTGDPNPFPPTPGPVPVPPPPPVPPTPAPGCLPKWLQPKRGLEPVI